MHAPIGSPRRRHVSQRWCVIVIDTAQPRQPGCEARRSTIWSGLISLTRSMIGFAARFSPPHHWRVGQAKWRHVISARPRRYHYATRLCRFEYEQLYVGNGKEYYRLLRLFWQVASQADITWFDLPDFTAAAAPTRLAGCSVWSMMGIYFAAIPHTARDSLDTGHRWRAAILRRLPEFHRYFRRVRKNSHAPLLASIDDAGFGCWNIVDASDASWCRSLGQYRCALKS